MLFLPWLGASIGSGSGHGPGVAVGRSVGRVRARRGGTRMEPLQGSSFAATLVGKSAATSSLGEPQQGSVPAHAASLLTAPILTTPFKIRHG